MKELVYYSSNGHEIKLYGRLFFTASSNSRKKLVHLIDLEPTDDWKFAHICDCESWRYHERPCRHVSAVVEAIAYWAEIPQPKKDEWIERILYCMRIGKTFEDALKSHSLKCLLTKPEKKVRIYNLHETRLPANRHRLPLKLHRQPA